MIQGIVNARLEAVLKLRVRGTSVEEVEVVAVIDTGFSASLTLPTSIITSLGLNYQSDGCAVLADGSVRQFEIYDAEVSWDGGWNRFWSRPGAQRHSLA